MPPLETADRNDCALLWPRLGRTRRGEPRVGQLIELNPRNGTGVRWVQKVSAVTAPDGSTVTATVRVVVDREIPLHSIMWRGGADDLPGTAQLPEGNLFEVVRYNETGDLKGRAENTRRTVDLTPFNDTFPEQVA